MGPRLEALPAPPTTPDDAGHLLRAASVALAEAVEHAPRLDLDRLDVGLGHAMRLGWMLETTSTRAKSTLELARLQETEALLRRVLAVMPELLDREAAARAAIARGAKLASEAERDTEREVERLAVARMRAVWATEALQDGLAAAYASLAAPRRRTP